MAEPIPISQHDLVARPYLAWNALVDLAHRPAEDLDETQRVAHFVFLYEGEVQNGGHLQFFENVGTEAVPLVRAALETVGADEHAHLLDTALTIRTAQGTSSVETAQDFVEAAAKGHYDACDAAFDECDTALVTRLETFLSENQGAFVLVTT